MTLPAEAIEAAVKWWTEAWEQEATRAAFSSALQEFLETSEGTHQGGRVLLTVDYDPQAAMLDVVRRVVPECRGFMCSAEGLLPMKTSMWVEPLKVEVSCGRGAPWETLWVRQ